jgi:cell division protease FtsH
MIKEIIIGFGAAVTAFLIYRGIDITPLLILGGLGFMMYFLVEKRGLLKSPVMGSSPQRPSFTFEHIGGQATAKQELKEALEFILQADMVQEMGIRPIKGILLTGPPGTGKTLLAKAAATYTDSVFLAASGSEFVEMYAGVGAQRVRQLFQTARETALKENRRSAIIFIDEIDVLATKRGTHASHMEYDQTLNQLLVEMDGIRTNDQVKILLVAATNRIDMLDPALLRPGRFDRMVRVDLPDKHSRLQILELHCKNKPLGPDIDLDQVVHDTFGFSGAHLESLANEAAILALRERASLITQEHMKEAIDKVIMGEKLDRKPTEAELTRVAVHETGHALVSETVRPDSVSHLTITPRGNALGYMRQTPEDDQYLYTKSQLEGQIMISLAGAVAEEIVLGDRSTGAASDFDQAVGMAKKIINSGLSSLGVISPEIIDNEILHRTMSDIIKEQEQKVLGILAGLRDVLGSIVAKLTETESISGDELRRQMKRNPNA